MEEENIVNKDKNKKKIIIGSIVIVLLLLVVVIGSTYAYFSLNVNGDGTNTKVTITTGSSNQIKLSGGLEDFHIKLEVKDMAYNRVNSEYYATSDKDLNYEKDKTNALTKIGEVEVIGELEERHICTASANVTLSGSMASLIQKGDLELSLQSEHYSNTSDLTEISDNYPATLTFILDNDTKPIKPQLINAYLKFTNRNVDQSYLAGQELNVSIIIEDFKCTTDTKAPEVNNFYINKNAEDNYTNNINNTAYITWLDEDVSEYCITNKEGSDNCTSWDKVEGNQVQKQIELTDTEGEQTYYVYLKDKANNISTGNRYATIIYDKTAPSITDVQAPNPQETSLTLQISANDTKEGVNRTSGIDKYCYSQSDSTNEGDYTCVTNSNITINNLQPGTSYTYYIYAKDKAGNSGITNKQKYTFKTKAKPIKDTTLTPADKNNTLQTEPLGGLYRYVGTKDQVKYNYICFGTSDKTQCLNTPNTYMYRIIGITDGSQMNKDLGLVEGQLKLIKAFPSHTSKAWNADYSSNIEWESSDVYKYLNNDFLTDAINNKWQIGTYWDSLITSPKWYIQDQPYPLPSIEPTGKTTGIASKIGLMYATDFANAGDQNSNIWLYAKNRCSSGMYGADWTMTRYGSTQAWTSGSGSTTYGRMDNKSYVSAVFYLTPNITLTGGGTESDPFIIHAS